MPSRPAPRVAATTSPKPSPSTASTSLAGSAAIAELRGLVTGGRLSEAAAIAAERARVADPGSYTLQVLFACQPSTVQSAFEKGGDDGLMVFSAPHEGSTCYRLTWGIFADRSEAVAQAASIPSHFAGSERPLPITLSKAAGL